MCLRSKRLSVAVRERLLQGQKRVTEGGGGGVLSKESQLADKLLDF